MNIILYLASKYLKFKTGDRGISTISIIAFLTIVISSAAAVVILSAANGFHHNLIEKLMSKDAHIMVIGNNGMRDYKDWILKIKKIPDVISVVPFFQKQVLIKGPFDEFGSEVMGVPTDYHEREKDFKKQFVMEDGSFSLDKRHSIVLGENLAQNLGVEVGSTVDLLVYDSNFFALQYRFRVTGIFSAGYKEYDSGLSFISFKDAQEIFNARGKAYGLAIKVKDPYHVERVLPELNRIGLPYSKWTWKNLNRNTLAAMENENVIMKVILFFFFVVVFFNILSTMIGMVLDKKEEIGILKAMGLRPGSVLQVFLFDGFLLGIAGSGLGVLLGLFFTVSLNTILHLIEYLIDAVNWSAYFLVSWAIPMAPPAHFEFFKSSVYYITQFPIQILPGDILFIVLLSVTVSTLAVIFPARHASKLRPVEVLRND